MRVTAGRIFTTLSLLAVAAGVAWLLWPQPVPVETAAVTKARFVATVDEDGKSRVRERYVVAAPVAGRMGRLRLKVGDPVAVGETVTTILPSPAPLLDPRSRREAEERVGAAEATRERAAAVVERARAQATQARTELDRARTLVARGAATRQALEHADLALRVADRDLRAAEFQDHAAQHELDQARALLARYDGGTNSPLDGWKVITPVAGVVLKLVQESETIVQPGTPLLEIGDRRDLEIVVDVLSTDAVEIRAGAEVMIERLGGPSALAGIVRRVEPIAFTKVSTLGVEEQRVNVLIDVVSPPETWAGLGDGYQVDTRIVVFAQDDTTVVPAGALFRRGETWHVYVVEAGRAQLRAVRLMRRSGRLAAIASGLSAQDQVIVFPSDRVSPGVRVAGR